MALSFQDKITPVSKGLSFADKITSTQTPLATSQTAKTETLGNPLFAAKQGESATASGFKTLGNMPSSALSFGKGIFNFLNPVKTVENLKNQAENIGTDMGQNPNIKVSPLDVAKEIPSSLYKMLVPQAFQNLFSGNIEQARQDITNDPIGQIAPFLMLAEGGAKIADTKLGGLTEQARLNAQNFSETGINVMPKKGIYQNSFENTVSKVAKPVIEPISSGLTAAGSVAKNVSTSAASYVTGLDKETVQKIISNPEAFTKIAQDNIDRGGIAAEVKKAIDTRLADLSETGKGYEKLREIPASVEIPFGTIENVLKKNKIELVDGKIKTGVESTPLSPTDINQLQHFVDTFGTEKILSNNAFLNARSALSDLSKYDATKTGRLTQIARDLRASYDTVGKEKMPGLKELDQVYAPEVSFLKQIKKDYLNADGTFKDGAVNKIANSTGAGKANLLTRLENVMPGITKRVQLLKAIEDIKRANSIKVGTYGKLAVGAGGYVLGGIPMAILAEIISSPTIAVPLLRGLGYTKAQIIPIVNALSAFAGDLNNLKTPESVKEYLKNPKLGMSIEDVSKNQLSKSPKTLETSPATQSAAKNVISSDIPKSSNKTLLKSSVKQIDAPTKAEMVDLIDYLRKGEANPKMETTLEKIGQKFNIKLDQPTAKIADKLEDLVAKTKTSDLLPATKLLKSSSIDPKSFKTAEEYANAQGTPVYHGTAAKFETFDNNMKGSITGSQSAKGAIWLTEDPATAKAYSIYAAETGPINKLMEQHSILEKIAQKSGKNSDWAKVDKLTQEIDDLGGYDSTYDRRVNANVKEAVIPSQLKIKVIDAKGKTPLELSNNDGIDSWLNTQVESAKSKGYDGLKIKNLDDAVGLYDKPATHYAIFDAKNIKTKSQLIEEWKKANKKVPLKK